MIKLTYKIYALSSPDMKVRYVGRTRSSLEARAEGHLSSAKNGVRPLHEWIRDSGDVVIRELERIKHVGQWEYSREAATRETWWISHFLEMGCDLFNIHQRPKVSKMRIVQLEEHLA